jgi:hypothetical protein
MDKTNRATPIQNRTEESDLNSDIAGWYWDSYSRRLVVSTGGESIDVFKTILSAVLGGGSESQRTAVRGTQLLIQGFEFNGGQILALDEGIAGELWLQSCVVKYGRITIDGAMSINESTESYRSSADGWGYHQSLFSQVKAIEIDCISTYAGDVDSFPDSFSNKNASSAHEGSSIVRVNGVYSDSLGPVIVDAGNNELTSWNMGVAALAPASKSASFYALSCEFWAHGCISSESLEDYRVEKNGRMYMNSCIGDIRNIYTSQDGTGEKSGFFEYLI